MWTLAALGLLVSFIPCGVACLRGGRFDRLVGLQLATLDCVLLLVVLSEALGRPTYLDVALTLAVLAFPGTLAFAIALVRWL